MIYIYIQPVGYPHFSNPPHFWKPHVQTEPGWGPWNCLTLETRSATAACSNTAH